MSASGKIIAGILALPIALAVSYCFAQREPAKPRFYVDDDLESDVWEIPIIEPYRLITTEPTSTSSSGYSRWDFVGEKQGNHAHPDSVNYQQKIITFHDPSQNQYGYYDLKRDKTVFLSDYQKFAEFVRSTNLDRALYNTEQVYRCWHQTRQLPWAKEIFIQNYGSTLNN